MKVYKAFAFLSIFIILFYNCSLPTDDEEKGDSEEEDTVTSEPLGRRDGQIHHQF